MAIGIFLVSAFIAVAAAVGTAMTGGGWLAILTSFLMTGWLVSIALAGVVALRFYFSQSGQMRRGRMAATTAFSQGPS